MDSQDLPPPTESQTPHNASIVGHDLQLATESQTPPPEKPVWGGWITLAFGLAVISALIGIQTVTTVAFMLISLASSPSLSLQQIVTRVMSSQEGLSAAVATIATAAGCIPLMAIFVKIRGRTSFAEYVGLRSVSKKALLSGRQSRWD